MKWHWIIGLVILIILSIINQYVTPSKITGYSLYFTGRVGFRSVEVGYYQRNLEIVRFISNCLFLYFLLTAYPYSLKSRKDFRFVLLPVIFISIIAVIYTISIEGNTFSDVILGKVDTTIRSIFHSKNEYGMFLFEASTAIIFLFYFDPNKKFRWFIFLVPLYFIFSLLIQCKSSFICIGILLFFSFAYSIVRLHFTRPTLSYVCLGIMVLMSLLSILFLSIDSLHSSGQLKRLYDFILDFFSSFSFRSMEERKMIWGLVPIITSGIYILIGFSSAVGGHAITILTSTEGEISTGVFSLHNAYIDFYAYHGIIGIIFLLALYIYVAYNIYKAFKVDKWIIELIVLIFISAIFFSNVENYMLFISMSANTFTLSMIVLAAPLYLNKKGEITNA